MRLTGLFCLVAADYESPTKGVLFDGDERWNEIITRDVDFIQAQYNKSNWFLDTVKVNRRSADLSKPFQVAIDYHNEKRELHCDTPLMTFDQEVAKVAQKIADKKIFEHSEAAERNYYGENLAWHPGPTPEDAVLGGMRMMYDEIYNYNWENPSYTGHDPTKAVGHFTQMVWKRSIKLGIGYARSQYNGMEGWLIVYQYSPAGNRLGTFASNVMPLKTTRKCSTMTTQKPTTIPQPDTTTELIMEEDTGVCNSCPAGWTAFQIGDKQQCIKYAGKYPLGNAHSECQKLDKNAKLPLPINMIENAHYIVVFLQMSLGQVGGVALDLNDVKTEGSWVKTSNGQKAAWLNWYNGEPNNWGRREDYVVLNVRIPDETNWIDAFEGSIVDVYCELNPYCPTGQFFLIAKIFNFSPILYSVLETSKKSFGFSIVSYWKERMIIR